MCRGNMKDLLFSWWGTFRVLLKVRCRAFPTLWPHKLFLPLISILSKGVGTMRYKNSNTCLYQFPTQLITFLLALYSACSFIFHLCLRSYFIEISNWLKNSFFFFLFGAVISTFNTNLTWSLFSQDFSSSLISWHYYSWFSHLLDNFKICFKKWCLRISDQERL